MTTDCGNFEAKVSGTVWGGSPCKNCDGKKKDHKDAPQTVHEDTPDLGLQVSTAPKKKVLKTEGTTEGSLAFFMGQALGVKHHGKSTGLRRDDHVISDDTRAYHASKEANKAMAKAFADMVVKGSDTNVGKFVTKKTGEKEGTGESKPNCAVEGCTRERVIKAYCAIHHNETQQKEEGGGSRGKDEAKDQAAAAANKKREEEEAKKKEAEDAATKKAAEEEAKKKKAAEEEAKKKKAAEEEAAKKKRAAEEEAAKKKKAEEEAKKAEAGVSTEPAAEAESVPDDVCPSCGNNNFVKFCGKCGHRRGQ